MPVYSAAYTGAITVAVNDLFDITAPGDSMVLIREIVIGQFSEMTDAQDEMLSISILRGHTSAGSGTPLTPANFNPRSRPAVTVVKGVSPALATGGSPATMIADSFNVRAGWTHRPPDRRGCILLNKSQRLVVRVSAPVDAIDSVNGTLIFEEVGDNHP